MRFYEFQNKNNIEKDLDTLSKLSDQDPAIKKNIVDGLKQILAKLNKKSVISSPGVTEDEEDINTLISMLLDRLDDTDLDPSERLRTKGEIIRLRQKNEKAAEARGFNLGTALADSKRKQIEEKSKKVAKKIGKDDAWGTDLSERLMRFQDVKLINLLLDNSLNNSCFKNSEIFTNNTVTKGKLQNFVIPELSNLFTNSEFKSLVQMPFDKRGLGPGEALLAILIPNAKKASKGDLEINNEIWEVKGAAYKADGSDNSSWIDSAGIGVKGNTLGEIFRAEVKKSLGNNIPNKLNVDGRDLDFELLLNLADFRKFSLSKLSAVMELLDYNKKKDIIDKIYSKLFPGCKEKISEEYDSFVNDSINLISEKNYDSLARIQTKFSLKEYGLGAYNSPNFIFYNPSYQDVIFSKGIDSVEDFYNDKQFVVSTITMRGDKPSPGIFLKSPEVKRRSRI
jgi:hypothetical protein